MSSTMPATAGHSQPCCNIPPVVSHGYYAPQGSYEELGGLKTYATGPNDATKGILVISDIFGWFDQTLQGADILATSDENHKYKVFMPDWFDGAACPTDWYPPDTPEKQAFFSLWLNEFQPSGTAASVPAFVALLKDKYPDIKSWGILGYCWGGKIVSLVTSSDDNPFSIAAAIHPAMVEPNDANSIKVPLIMLASMDEDAKAVKEFEDTLTVPKHVEVFPDQNHGWMAARADLTDYRVKEEYFRGYKTVLQFFGENWK